MSTPKILILVLSYNEPPFDVLMRTQQASWDSVEVEGVKTIYYYGGGKGWVNEKEFSGAGDDSYYYMHDKLLDCLKNINLSDVDIIFRTNSSSYIQKEELVKFAKTLPKNNVYCGWEINGNEGFNIISGAGIFMTPDIVNILINEINPEFEKEEDYYIASILYKHGVGIIDNKSRFDVPSSFIDLPTDRYHYRCKCGADRLVDIKNMKTIHNLLCS